MFNKNKKTQSEEITDNAPGRLPADTHQAMRSLLRATKGLIMLAEREHQALAKNDLMEFAILQGEKNGMAEHYAGLAQDFRRRLEDFRSADKNLLAQLEREQAALGEKTKENNALINAIIVRSRQNTKSTLLSAQELAQRFPVAFAYDQDTLAANGEDDARA